jgi:UDP-glucose 4-epimerase
MLARLASGNAKITVLSRDEKKQDDLKKLYPNVTWLIGDTRDPERVRQAMRGQEVVFHAAALKQVPNCESHPMEAVKTNVVGTETCLKAAGEAGVRRFVTLSTDKACYPINAMGLTKALAEKLTLNANHIYPDTSFVCTRYGNVLRSRGSVVPLWEEQAASGQTLMLTNPRMTRFLMTLDEAVNLVLLAFDDSERECIYVLKSPAAYMEDVARVISSNVVVGKIRPGEKLDETLITAEEMRRTIDCGHWFRVAMRRSIKQSHYFETNPINQGCIEFDSFKSSTTTILSTDEIRAILYPEVKR